MKRPLPAEGPLSLSPAGRPGGGPATREPRAPPATRLDASEAVEAVWIPLRTLLDPGSHALRPVPTRPPSMLFPAIELPCLPLWGFTYRLLTDWLSPDPPPDAGFDAAQRVLAFVLSRGLTLQHDWTERVAAVSGTIPVEAAIEHFTRPAHFHPAINCLDIHADQIRIAGPEFEEYVIRAT